MTDFTNWFRSITSKQPFPYQKRFADELQLPEQLNVITGAGKTATVVLGWLWRRRFHPNQNIRDRTPRRLVYCLPMRTLVEQTYAEVERWLKKAGLTGVIELHLLMGGAVSDRWDAYPEKDCILIGTQDQLLSRALNRGYSMSRYRWPIHFALLNNDCLWVMDEVQLMGAGLRTTAQLQGFREEFGAYGCTNSLWMSATLDSELLTTVNYQPDLSKIHCLTEEDKAHPILQQRLQAKKELVKASTVIQGKEEDAKVLASEVAQIHTPGTLTIVICNRVGSAQAVFQELEKRYKEDELLLIHSRFRPRERQELNQKLYKFSAGILIATQAIEAGVDISAQTLITELAPWSSLVQRIGRCNRYGEHSEGAVVYWVDIDLNKKQTANPYQAEALSEARILLSSLKEVSPSSLQAVKAKPQEVKGLIPRKHDLLQLFDTSTDLAGHDIDVSPFIRESDDTDVAIAWRNWDGDKPEGDFAGAVQQDELCRVSIWQAQAMFKNKGQQYWVWDGLQGDWIRQSKLYPGLTILLHCSDGGYSKKLGFTGNPKHQPEPVESAVIELEQDDTDPLTYQVGEYVTLRQHSSDVASSVLQICSSMSKYGLATTVLVKAGRWHDLGKVHPVFQEMLTRDRPDIVGGPWAKSDQRARTQCKRRGFRHELVSALVALKQGESFLLTYLVAAHHGKIRMTIQPRPHEKPPLEVKRYAMGVWEGDDLPAVDLGDGVISDTQKLSLACMEIGEGEDGASWTAQAIALLEEYGPFKLAFLETIIRIADWRASAKYADDILRRTDA